MKVKEMYEYLRELIQEGKGEYYLVCEGGLGGVGGPGIIDEKNKTIEVG